MLLSHKKHSKNGRRLGLVLTKNMFAKTMPKKKMVKKCKEHGKEIQ